MRGEECVARCNVQMHISGVSLLIYYYYYLATSAFRTSQGCLSEAWKSIATSTLRGAYFLNIPEHHHVA